MGAPPSFSCCDGCTDIAEMCTLVLLGAVDGPDLLDLVLSASGGVVVAFHPYYEVLSALDIVIL